MTRHRTIIRLSAALAGVALVWACGGDSPTAPPAPEPARPTTVTVSPATVELTALGATVQLTVEVHDQNDKVMAGVTVTWTSSAGSVVTVDASGLVTGVAEGMATITASVASASGSAAVTVIQPVVSVEVSPSSETIGLGSTLQLTADGFDENGDAVEGAEFSWESSDAAVATVDTSGLVTGVAVGVATIMASAGIGQGTAEITVMDLERAALVALYEATDGPNWINSENWLTDAPLGDWYGVDTDAAGRVIRLDLPGSSDSEGGAPHGLSGTIPPELGSLVSLESLDFGYNLLSGPIPSELGSLANLRGLNLRANRLSGTIPPELRDLASLVLLWIGDNRLSGTIPPELRDLASLKFLGLWSNNLSGPIPPELGEVTGLERVHLQRNNLTGPIPESFLELNGLELLRFERNADACAPGTTGFVTWLERIETVSGPYCNESDTSVLESLFEVAGGPGWTNAEGWLSGPSLGGWHGVSADSLGRVTALDLSRNGLAGQLPANLSELAHMAELRIAHNTGLSGRLPLSLADLSLQALHYAGTELCAPVNTSFRDWLRAIPSHEGTGASCGSLSDREVLEALYDATGGPDWIHNENWRTDAPLREWYGVEVDDQERVVGLRFVANGLTGRIPRELGSLANLQSLVLRRDPLTGSIPSEFGDLANLRRLHLRDSDLTGPIPRELGNLANLRILELNDNDLTGPIPAELGNLTGLRHLNLAENRLTGRITSELGNLTNLWTLYLGRNDLTGSIPTELSRLAGLQRLNLAANRLTGPIPRELGGLTELTMLYLGENDLAGPVPPEFGGLTQLRSLALQSNADMSGVLPASLTKLASLKTFQTDGTGLCAPSEADFLAWLEGVSNRRVALCEGESATAYLVQAVQSRDFPVPLVAGEEALLRVFVTAGRDNDEPLPRVRVSFYLNGALAHVADIPGKPGPIPQMVDEGSLAASANALIPAEVVWPGLEMVVEIDPDGTLDAALGLARRIPDTGQVAIDVQALPVFDLTVVPFLWTADPDSAILESVGGMATDPEGHELLRLTRTLLPVGVLEVTAHEPVLSSSNFSYDLLGQTRAIRVMEGGTGYYMGTISGSMTGSSLGGGVASFARPNAFSIAHEFGHNFSLPHAPCGGAGNPDPAYPYADGTIGAWGYDARRSGSLVQPSRFDLMGYCVRDSAWVSDYFFTKALHFRLTEEGPRAAAALASAGSLLLWGGIDAEGKPFLNPTFVVDTPPELPDSAGEHRITGRSTSGEELFTLSFAMPDVADGDGSSSFALGLPVQPGWASNLASITLSGPGGSVTLDDDTDIPMAILIDASTGQVRGILRDLPQRDAAAALAPQAAADSLDVLFSRGIPDAAAWSR